MSAIPEWKQALIRAKEAKKKEQDRKLGGEGDVDEVAKKFAHLPAWKRDHAMKKWHAEQHRLKDEESRQEEARRRGSSYRHSLADKFEGESKNHGSVNKACVLSKLGAVASISDRLQTLKNPTASADTTNKPVLQRRLSRKSSFEKNGFTLVALAPVEHDPSLTAETSRSETVADKRSSDSETSNSNSNSSAWSRHDAVFAASRSGSVSEEPKAVNVNRDAERQQRSAQAEEERRSEQDQRERAQDEKREEQRRKREEAVLVARKQREEAEEAQAATERQANAKSDRDQQELEKEQAERDAAAAKGRREREEKAAQDKANADREREEREEQERTAKEAKRQQMEAEAKEARERREEQRRSEEAEEEAKRAQDAAKAKEIQARAKVRDCHPDLAQNHVENQTPAKAGVAFEYVPQPVPDNETKEQEKARKRKDRENRMKAKATKRLAATQQNASKYAEEETATKAKDEADKREKDEKERLRKEKEAQRKAELKEDETRLQNKRENARIAWERQKVEIEAKEKETKEQKENAEQAEKDRRHSVLEGGPTSTMSWPKGCLPNPATLKLKRTIVWRDENSDDAISSIAAIDFYSDDEYDEPQKNMSSKQNEDAGLSTPVHRSAQSKIDTRPSIIDDKTKDTPSVGNMLW